jgi:hypothetical protein
MLHEPRSTRATTKTAERVLVSHAYICYSIPNDDTAAGLDVEHTRQHLYRGPGTGATVAGTPGAALVEGLQTQHGEHVIIKKRFSPFFQTHLDMVLRRCEMQQLLLLLVPERLSMALHALYRSLGASVLLSGAQRSAAPVPETAALALLNRCIALHLTLPMNAIAG